MSTSTPTILTLGAGLTGGVSGVIYNQGTITEQLLVNAQTGTSYTVQASDNTKLITFNNASAVAVTLPVVTTSGFGTGFFFQVWNYGAGTVTVTPTTSKINNGASSLTIPQNTGVTVVSDGSNYQICDATSLITGSSTTVLPRGYIGGLTLSNDGTSPNTVIDISAGMCVDSTTAALMTLAAFKKSTSTWASGSGNGGLQTGLTLSASTWYHVFVISNAGATTVDALLSTSATAPTLPSGFTLFRRIGSIKTNSSSNITTFVQDCQIFYWGTQVLDVSSASPTSSSRTLYTLSVPLGVKVRPIGRYSTATSASLGYIFTSPDETDVAPSATSTTVPLSDILSSTSIVISNALNGNYYTNTSSQIGVRASGTTNAFSLVTRGWVDDRGIYN